MPESPPIQSPLMTAREAALYLGVSVSWCYHELKAYVPHVKIGHCLRYRREDIDRYIASRVNPPSPLTRDIKSNVSLRELLGRGKRLPKTKQA